MFTNKIIHSVLQSKMQANDSAKTRYFRTAMMIALHEVFYQRVKTKSRWNGKCLLKKLPFTCTFSLIDTLWYWQGIKSGSDVSNFSSTESSKRITVWICWPFIIFMFISSYNFLSLHHPILIWFMVNDGTHSHNFVLV